MQKTYTWEYRIRIAPYDKIMQVLEAFFASYPDGDYTCEHREQYKLRFRRGLWRRSLLSLGAMVPDRLPKGQFSQWPMMVYVLVRPSPETFMITVRYELHLPKSVPALIASVQASVDQHAQKELDELAAYVAECAGLKEQPAVTPL